MSLALALLLAAAAPSPEWTVTSDAFELDGRTNDGHASGHVHAVNDAFELVADEAVAKYDRRRGRPPVVTSLTLTGHVRARRLSDGAEAAGGRATWGRATGRVELTEAPSAQRGGALVEGGRIVLFTADDHVEVTDARVTTPSETGGTVRLTTDALKISNAGERMRCSGSVHLVDGPREARAEQLEAALAQGTGGALRLVRARFSGDVRLRDGALRSTSGSAVFEAGPKRVTLTGAPRMHGPEGELAGERIVYDGRTGRARSERAKVRLREVRR